MSSSAAPTTPEDRIISLDVLRGVAILGILVINIQSISMPSIARINPATYGGFEGANYIVWLLSHVFVEQKFIVLFSMLFGAGVLLFVSSKQSKGEPALKLHYKRTFWLLVIGLAHAYLLWDGDILVTYALCSLVVVLAYNWPAERLVVAAVVLLSVPFIQQVETVMMLDHGMELGYWTTTPEELQQEIAVHQGSWSALAADRFGSNVYSQTIAVVDRAGWRYSGAMLLGMALFRWGVLSNERSSEEYIKLVAGCFTLGITLTVAGVAYLHYHDWGSVAGFSWGLFNYWGSILVSISYVGAVMLFCRRWAGGLVEKALSSVGRTALSNYLFQTVVATTIFYGHGFGLFGQVSRVEQMGIVLFIWVVQVSVSVLWLQRFRYGPAEWVWRSLTYGRA